MKTEINQDQLKGGSSGGSASFSANSSYLPLGKRDTDNDQGDTFQNQVFLDSATSRVYSLFLYDSIPSNTYSRYLRTFKNDFGSYYYEKDIAITRSMLTDTNASYTLGAGLTFTTDGTYIYAICMYSKNTAGIKRRVDIVRLNTDGTFVDSTNIYTTNASSDQDQILWGNNNHNTQAATVSGTQLFTTWTQTIATVETDQIREYTISGNVYTLVNTYTRSGFSNAGNAHSLTYDANTSTFYFSGGHDSGNSNPQWIEKYSISGANFVQGSNQIYPFLGYGNNQIDTSTTDIGYSISNLEFGVSFYTVYVVQFIKGSAGSLGASQVLTAYWLQALNLPIF